LRDCQASGLDRQILAAVRTLTADYSFFKDADWKSVYKPIAGRHSWGMPAEILNRLKDEL
jgi:hypothetical protein